MKELIQGNAMRYESNGRAYIDLEQEHKPTYSVTTIIDRAWGVNQYLAEWQAKFGHKKANETIDDILRLGVDPSIFDDKYLYDLPVIEQKRYVDERARIGTMVHSILMYRAQGWVPSEKIAFTPEGHVDLKSKNYEECPEEVKYRVHAAIQFWEDCDVEILGTEVAMHSPNYLFSGTADLICRIAGKVWEIDYKTGNGIYINEHVQQNCYGLLANDQIIKIDRLGLLHIPKEGTWKKSSRKGWKNAKEYCLIEVEWNKRIVDALVEKFTFLNNNIRPKGKE
jgi:hypothetical protein